MHGQMSYITLESTLLAATAVAEAGLVGVLCWRGRWRVFPAFTALIFFLVASSCLFWFLGRTSPRAYLALYWPYVAANCSLQLLVVWEMGRQVLRPARGLARSAWKQFLIFGVLGAAVALALAYLVAPPGNSWAEQVGIRANLFTSLLTCELVIVMMMTASNTGLGWRNHVMAIGEGFLGWSTIAVIMDSLHSYFGAGRYFFVPECTKELASLVVFVYWCVQLWREEPARQEISPELRKYIVALHQRVHYDLGELER
jgi:hypothetical protein